MPKKIDEQKLINNAILSKIKESNLFPLSSFNLYDNKKILLQTIDLNNINEINISEFFQALQNSTKEEQLEFFKNNINQKLEKLNKLFTKSIKCVIMYSLCVFIHRKWERKSG